MSKSKKSKDKKTSNKLVGGLFSTSKKDKDNSILVIKFVFYLILVRNSLSSFQSFINNNENNSYNILLQMINGNSVWRDYDNKMTIYFKKYYDKVINSNSFYNVFPQNYSFYSKLPYKALKISNIPTKKGGSFSNKKTSKTKKKKELFSYNNYLKSTPINNNESKTIDKELSILYRYVYISLYLKYKMIKFLKDYYYENKLEKAYFNKIRDLLYFYNSFTTGSKYLSMKYIKEIEYILDELKELFKYKYGVIILKSNLLKTIKYGLNINIDNLFELEESNIDQINILYDEFKEYDKLESLMEGNNN
jgi:hypothetical protein